MASVSSALKKVLSELKHCRMPNTGAQLVLTVQNNIDRIAPQHTSHFQVIKTPTKARLQLQKRKKGSLERNNSLRES